MSVFRITETVTIGLWCIEETTAEFYAKHPFLAPYRSVLDERYTHDARKLEFLAVHALLCSVLGHDAEISHLPSGKPLLDNYHVSISHTKGYAAIILSAVDDVAIDIEYMGNRVDRVADRFIRDDERAETLAQRLVLWSAKETAYKFYSMDGLPLKDLKVFPFEVSDKVCLLTNLQGNHRLNIHFELTADYVLTYAYDSPSR